MTIHHVLFGITFISPPSPKAPGAIGLVFEFASGGELFTRMKKQVKFSENVARFYFSEVASALGYLHAMNIVYRDLKPENILLDCEGHIKLCDFGFASFMSSSDALLHDGCGTAMYVAPEIASGHMKKAHGLPVDWWGLGCILYEMLVGKARCVWTVPNIPCPNVLFLSLFLHTRISM